jgi:hypothetical protein
MSHSLASPPPATSVREFMARLWAEPDSRSTLVGMAGVLVFLLLMLMAWIFDPPLFRHEALGLARPHANPREFSIELAPETFAKAPPKPTPFKFVETNPDAPDNAPDKTENFGAHNQQVAQEKPTPDGRSDRPAIDGKKDFENTQIVSGQLTKPIEHMEAQPPPIEVPVAEATIAAPKAEQNPLPGFEKKEGESKESFGSNITRIPENIQPVTERVEGAKNVPLIQGATAMQPAIDPKRPRPRPQVVKQQQVRPAILAENKFGTTNIGPVAYDARWSNYGSYLQRLIESVQFQWERLLIEGKTYPPSGTTVTVKFILNDAGNIAKIVKVDNHSTEHGANACISAITDRAPYGPWTDDMKAVLGTEQELTFTFYYQ